MRRVEVECVEESDHVRDEVVDPVGVDSVGSRTGRVSALVRGVRPQTGLVQQGADGFPNRGALRKPVQQNDGDAVGRTAGRDVECQVAEGDVRVFRG